MSTNILLLIVVAVSTGWALWTGIANHRRMRLNQQIGEELDDLIKSTMQMAKTNMAAAGKDKTKKSRQPEGYGDWSFVNGDLSSPEILSTLLTVIVNKYGNLRLGLEDFTTVADVDYVSVYVDTKTNEILLSLDHQLGPAVPMSMINFKNSDDNTFH